MSDVPCNNNSNQVGVCHQNYRHFIRSSVVLQLLFHAVLDRLMHILTPKDELLPKVSNTQPMMDPPNDLV